MRPVRNRVVCGVVLSVLARPLRPEQIAPVWQIPNIRRSRPACRNGRRRIESEELNNQFPVRLGWAILVLLPFLDCCISNSKSKQFRQLRHGQREVDSLLAEVFSEGCRRGGVVP
jgi:hypothetical protein